MRVFIAGDSSHAPRVFGFSARLKMSTYLARPVSDLISNALQSPFLTEDQRRMTARAGFPTLPLIRAVVGGHQLAGLGPGEWRDAN